MTPAETAAILRKFAQCLRADKYLWGASLPGVSAEVGAAVESAIALIDRTQEIEIAMRDFTWSNDSESQADCARAALEKSK